MKKTKLKPRVIKRLHDLAGDDSVLVIIEADIGVDVELEAVNNLAREFKKSLMAAVLMLSTRRRRPWVQQPLLTSGGDFGTMTLHVSVGTALKDESDSTWAQTTRELTAAGFPMHRLTDEQSRNLDAMLKEKT